MNWMNLFVDYHNNELRMLKGTESTIYYRLYTTYFKS